LAIASDLVRRGASIPEISRATEQNKGLSAMRLWGRLLSRLSESQLGVAYTYVLRKDLLEFGMDDEAIEGLANYLGQLRDMKAIMVISERENGQVKVSMRTHRDDIDLSRLAAAAGGGGHKKAAGFSVPACLEVKGGRVCLVKPEAAR
jgi:phosphoesterase RecJ-like protein